VAQHLDYEVVSSQRPDGARDLVTCLAKGALAHDHEHVARLQRLAQPAEPLLPRRRAPRSGVLEVEDPNAEASQVVPLLDDRRYVVRGDDEPDHSRTSSRAFHQSRVR
jgi:hypothetical protein